MSATAPLVLGIETSCDETGVALVRGHELLVDAVASSVDEHARFGGIIPEIASRAHLEAMVPTIERALATADVTLDEVDAIAVTAGPGLAAYLRVYLRPLVHCVRAHALAFMPHGENVILVLEGHVPVGAFLKDIGEEVTVLDDQPLPPDVERIRAHVEPAERADAILVDVLDGVLRHLAAILVTDGVLTEDEFWGTVARCVDEHAADHPDLPADVDVRVARFRHSCLNRLQLRNTLQMVDLADQAGSFVYAGTLANPVARDGVLVAG